jgi:hypothetical protein
MSARCVQSARWPESSLGRGRGERWREGKKRAGRLLSSGMREPRLGRPLPIARVRASPSRSPEVWTGTRLAGPVRVALDLAQDGRPNLVLGRRGLLEGEPGGGQPCDVPRRATRRLAARLPALCGARRQIGRPTGPSLVPAWSVFRGSDDAPSWTWMRSSWGRPSWVERIKEVGKRGGARRMMVAVGCWRKAWPPPSEAAAAKTAAAAVAPAWPGLQSGAGVSAERTGEERPPSTQPPCSSSPNDPSRRHELASPPPRRRAPG